MEAKKLYEIIGGDYEDALHRFLSDEKINKFLKMLYNDDNYTRLKQALAEEDYEHAFIASHTIKGILLNLSLNDLADLSCKLTEVLREKKYNPSIPILFEEFHDRYEELLKELSKID